MPGRSVTTEPKFGDVYQWRAGGQKVMVISDDPLAYVMLSDVFTEAVGEVKVFPSNNQKVPFSSPTDSWIRVDGR